MISSLATTTLHQVQTDMVPHSTYLCSSSVNPCDLAKSYPPEELDTEFKRKYPPDAFGEEAADNARVWKVYYDEAIANDRSLLEGWNKTLDILLIFVRRFLRSRLCS